MTLDNNIRAKCGGLLLAPIVAGSIKCHRWPCKSFRGRDENEGLGGGEVWKGKRAGFTCCLQLESVYSGKCREANGLSCNHLGLGTRKECDATMGWKCGNIPKVRSCFGSLVHSIYTVPVCHVDRYIKHSGLVYKCQKLWANPSGPTSAQSPSFQLSCKMCAASTDEVTYVFKLAQTYFAFLQNWLFYSLCIIQWKRLAVVLGASLIRLTSDLGGCFLFCFPCHLCKSKRYVHLGCLLWFTFCLWHIRAASTDR